MLLSLFAGSCMAQGRPTASRVSANDAEALSKALAACDRGEGAAARPELERLAGKYPGNFAANEALGIVYVDASDFLHAVPYLEHAAAAARTNVAAQANLGAAYLATGNNARAVETLRRAVGLDPKNASTLAGLGRALYRDKLPSAAAEAFRKATALDPGNADDLYNEAVALYDLRRDAEAVAALRHISEMARNDAIEALWGDAEERLGHSKEAVEHLQRAARLNPNEASVYALAIELLRHWSWEPAAEVTSFGVQQYPESKRLRLASGIAAFGSGKYVAAAATFGGLLALDPDNESYGSLLGKSCAAAGGAEAPECASLVAFAEAHPKNAQTDTSAAVSLLHGSSPEQHLDQAQRLLERAIATSPEQAEAYYQLGVLKQQRLQWKESAASLEKAIALRPSFAEAHYRLARAYSHTGEPELAKREIALQQRYSQQEKDETDARLKEVTIFLMASH